MTVLRDDNFLLVCAALYQNPQCCSEQEFYDDLSRIKYVKKLITRYVETGELKERLILNHIVVLGNVFGAAQLARLLFFKMEPQFEYVKPFLEFLSLMPKHIDNVREVRRVISDTIKSDSLIEEKLKLI
jgi:hypothetical protein